MVDPAACWAMAAPKLKGVGFGASDGFVSAGVTCVDPNNGAGFDDVALFVGIAKLNGLAGAVGFVSGALGTWKMGTDEVVSLESLVVVFGGSATAGAEVF